MLLALGPNITLDAVNSTKLPYLIGAQFPSGRTHFLCPTPGLYEPIRSSVMCKQVYTSYKGREIKVGFHDFSYPYGYIRENKPNGTDGYFMELIQNMKNFTANFNFNFTSHTTAFQLVILLVKHYNTKYMSNYNNSRQRIEVQTSLLPGCFMTAQSKIRWIT